MTAGEHAADVAELRRLVETLGLDVVGEVTQHRDRISPATVVGEGKLRDLDLLLGVAGNIVGKTLCAFGDAAATPALTTVKNFRHEYEAHIREGRCTLPAPWRATRTAQAH